MLRLVRRAWHSNGPFVNKHIATESFTLHFLFFFFRFQNKMNSKSKAEHSKTCLYKYFVIRFVPRWRPQTGVMICSNVLQNVRGRLRLKCDGTRAENTFRLSPKRRSPFKSAGAQFGRLLAAEVCASAVVILDSPRSEVVWRVLATHSIRQFPLHL